MNPVASASRPDDQPTHAPGGLSPNRRPVAIDLFAGAGGLSLGFEMAGFDVLSAVEYDPVHAATHMYNFPNTDVLCRDVKSINGDDLRSSAEAGWIAHYPGTEWDGIVDAIIGGPSCQGFSTMGKQDVNDSRNELIDEFVRLVVEVRPRAFCMENVPGFLDARFSPLRDRALKALRAAGYSISGEDLILSATDFGVPQSRKRVLIVGVLGSRVVSIEVPNALPVFTVSDALAGLAGSLPTRAVEDLVELDVSDRARVTDNQNTYLKLADVLGDGSGYFGHARLVKNSTLSGCRMTTHTKESVLRFAGTPQGSTETVSRAFRLSMTKPARTLRAGTGRERGAFSASRPLHPVEDRVITVREAARLHSFPDWFRFHTTNWHGHRQIGNAVPPLLAVAAGKAILKGLGLTAVKSRIGELNFGDEALLRVSPSEAARLLAVDATQVPKRAARMDSEALLSAGEIQSVHEVSTAL